MTTDRDEMIVEACLAGDRKAFELLVDRYEKKLFNAAYRIVGDIEDAADATQSAFVKAYEKLDTFKPSCRFFPWMYRILINESLNIVNYRRRFAELDSKMELRDRSPDQKASDRELSRHLHAAMMDLKPDQRVVVALRHYQGFTYKEIGQVLRLPEKTVKSRLFTARRQLRAILQRKGIVA